MKLKNKPYEDSREWADGYLPEIGRVIRSYPVVGSIVSIKVANDEQDRQCATDYIVTVSNGDIGCRIREWKYWKLYGDITLRYERPSGIPTEFEKILNGYGRWYLYAWAKGDGFGAWVFIDLDKLRESGLLEEDHIPIWNKDRSSSFIYLKVDRLARHGCVVAAGGEAIKFRQQQAKPLELELAWTS